MRTVSTHDANTVEHSVQVTVIIPLYNKARCIARAIDSVLAQTHQDFELIVMDDGSTDESVSLVRKIADPRLRLIYQANTCEPETQ